MHANPSLPCLRPAFQTLAWTLASLLALMLWDLSALDLPMAHWFGSAAGFPLQDHWLWRGLLHDDVRPVGWLVELVLLAAIGVPAGFLRLLPVERRAQLALTTLAGLLVVSLVKLQSHSSCPWDLQAFGGVATYVSHWNWGVTDGGNGGCFPAGHASTGFAFIGGFFALRQLAPVLARRWLAAALFAGFLLGMAQQVRGAHFMSHTLWTAWLCWTTAAVLDQVFSVLVARKRSRAPAPVPGLAALKP